jgi:DNA-binding transcriptional LysR family regulator
MHECMTPPLGDFDWNHARAFWLTAEAGSLSAAARRLGVAQPTVGRQVAALEEALGVLLLERDATGVRLTDAGAELLEPLRWMAKAAGEVSLTAAGAAGQLEGLVRVTASEMVAVTLLTPIVAELRAAYPGIRLELVATQEVRDLRKGEADLAVRNTAPTDPELLARRLPDVAGAFYATTAYWASLGPLTSAADLARGQFLGFEHSAALPGLLRSLGVPVADDHVCVASASHLVQWAFCRAGLGIGVGLCAAGDADPGLARAPLLPTLPVPMWLVSHRALRTSRRLRVVSDALAAGLGAG